MPLPCFMWQMDTEDTVDTVDTLDTLDSVCVASDLMRLIVSEKVIVPYTLIMCHLVLSSCEGTIMETVSKSLSPIK